MGRMSALHNILWKKIDIIELVTRNEIIRSVNQGTI